MIRISPRSGQRIRRGEDAPHSIAIRHGESEHTHITQGGHGNRQAHFGIAQTRLGERHPRLDLPRPADILIESPLRWAADRYGIIGGEGQRNGWHGRRHRLSGSACAGIEVSEHCTVQRPPCAAPTEVEGIGVPRRKQRLAIAHHRRAGESWPLVVVHKFSRQPFAAGSIDIAVEHDVALRACTQQTGVHVPRSIIRAGAIASLVDRGQMGEPLSIQVQTRCQCVADHRRDRQSPTDLIDRCGSRHRAAAIGGHCPSHDQSLNAVQVRIDRDVEGDRAEAGGRCVIDNDHRRIDRDIACPIARTHSQWIAGILIVRRRVPDKTPIRSVDDSGHPQVAAIDADFHCS